MEIKQTAEICFVSWISENSLQYFVLSKIHSINVSQLVKIAKIAKT